MSSMRPYGILFVCTGNICRSPTAEAVLRHKAQGHKWSEMLFYDSAATQDYHVGHSPDERTVKAAENRDIEMADLRARKLTVDDFYKYDIILGMDEGHMEIMQALAPADCTAKLLLFTTYAPGSGYVDVPDPYYGGAQGFEVVLDLITEGVDGLLHHIETEII